MKRFEKDIAIIGVGRVGLPLGLSLASEDFTTIGIDIDKKLIDSVNCKTFPFNEPGYDELIKKVDFTCTDEISTVQNCENIIITVGTPLLAHIETDLSQVKRVISSILPHIRQGHNIMLRSTIAPKTSLFVKNYLEQKTGFTVGKDIFFSFCPERLAEGKAMMELYELPQIIGSEDTMSGLKAENIFAKLTSDILHTNFISAELVKLFNNISRYVHFSIANQFAIIADNYNANIYDIINMTNYKYPRGVIPQPGMTAGTCLRKDFGMINETIPYTDLLLSAWKVNEYMPLFLVENMKQKTSLLNKRIAILGYTFKKDVDDTRDSLIPKLVRYIERENPIEINIHDPFLGTIIDGEYENKSLEEALKNADIVYLAINHTIFSEKVNAIFDQCGSHVWFADIWNVCKNQRIFFQNPNSNGEK